MSESRSLRALLVVNTLLAGGLLWTLAVGATPLTRSAEATQYRSSRAGSPPPEAVSGVGNAAARQRDRMIKSLADISKRLDAVEKRLSGGDVRVAISNADELAIDYERLAELMRGARD